MVTTEEAKDGVVSEDVSPTTHQPPPPPEADEPDVSPRLSESHQKRNTRFQNLKLYEVKRTEKSQRNFDSSNLYWRSFRTLLTESVLETDRAIEIVEARMLIDRAYAESLEAIGRGDLDSANNPITSSNSKKLKKKVRGEADAATVARRGSLFRMNSEGLLESREQSELGMLSSIIRAHGDQAARYNENVAAIQNEILPELTSLHKSLAEEVSKIELYGDALMLELEASEEKVKGAWAAYEHIVEGMLGGGRGEAKEPREDGLVDDAKDSWCVEMKYTLSVVLVERVWKKANSELGELFARMKTIEFDRRARLQQLLVAFLQRQEQLYLSLPAIYSPSMKSLVEKPIDREKVNEEIGAAIRTGAQNIQLQENRAKLAATKLETDAMEQLAADQQQVVLSELPSPLMSKLLGKVKVLERKKDGMMGGWKLCLALMTADSFLHLFDIPSSAKIQAGSAAEVAFGALIPEVQLPDRATVEKSKVHKKKTSDVVRPWHGLLHPSDSIVLQNSSVQFLPKSGDSCFEVSETIFNTGPSGFFSKTSKRKFTLRAVTQDEAVDWIVSLKAQGGGK